MSYEVVDRSLLPKARLLSPETQAVLDTAGTNTVVRIALEGRKKSKIVARLGPPARRRGLKAHTRDGDDGYLYCWATPISSNGASA